VIIFSCKTDETTGTPPYTNTVSVKTLDDIHHVLKLTPAPCPLSSMLTQFSVWNL